MTMLAKLLYPGLHIKRWLLLLAVGMVLTSLGLAFGLIEVARPLGIAGALAAIALASFPPAFYAVLLLLVGVLLSAFALQGLYRSLADVLSAQGSARPSLLDMIYDYRLRQTGPRVVCIGGGTGMPSVLRSLKNYTRNITAVVTVGDNGGSSGRLRREHGILPPGDFRNNIVALAEVEPLMQQLLQYRFPRGSALEGHSFGNLFVLAMTGITGNFVQALRETSRVLAVKGSIVPSTTEDVTICARFADGTEVCGESEVPEAGKPIEHIFLKPEHPGAQPEAVKAILEADLIVLGPGSLFTSVIPNLLVEGVAKALIQSEALKVYVCNVASQPGETDGFDVKEHVMALARHLPGGKNPLDVVIANRQAPGARSPDEQVALVYPPADGWPGGPQIVLDDVVRDDHPLRHDPEKLGGVLMRTYYDRRASRHARG